MSDDIHQYKILILDFGSQYTQLIARRVREVGVYCEIHSHTISQDAIAAFKPHGIILSGGPASVRESTPPRIPDCVFEIGVPVLGICYGMQAMAKQLGGTVELSQHHEYGHADVTVSNASPLLKGMSDDALLAVWMSHGDHVTRLPEGFEVTAHTSNAPIAAIANVQKNFYGLQFHPEVTHTQQGLEILRRFVLDICQCEALWDAKHITEELITSARQQVGDDTVLLGLSGGVDSSVVAALLHKAIGQQLVCVFVDTGLLRLNEVSQVQNMFAEHLGVNLITVDAKNEFYNALRNEADPEAKRKIIGKTFIDIFEREANKLSNVKWLAQGTIYPDVIESAKASDGASTVIKSHHNVGGLPERMQLKLLEPIRECFKDEVRQLGLELGLPYDMVYRHPFPGPGLGVRILGEIKQEYAETLRLADHIFIEELHNAKLYHKVAQAFAVFLPVKSVGVTGDARRYEYVIALRCVETTDFMTAHWSRLPYELLATVSNRIINEVPNISRVTYDISGKPPATIEWE